MAALGEGRNGTCPAHWIAARATVIRPAEARLIIAAAGKQQLLFDNTARAMGDAPKEVKLRHIGNCLKADPAYGEGVAKALGIPLSDVPK